MNKPTWKELKAQGVRRCCAVFKSGKQCARRQHNNSGWCSKHGPAMTTLIAKHVKIIRQEAGLK
jgi:hypothetical protein